MTFPEGKLERWTARPCVRGKKILLRESLCVGPRVRVCAELLTDYRLVVL